MSLLKPSQLYDYQRECIAHQLTHPDSMLWLQMGLGKAQPLDELILTPSGWVTMGDVKPGSQVVGSDGQPVEVLSVHPQGNREVVRITFNDGSSVRCDWEHLWNVNTDQRTFDGKPWQTKTTRELFDEGLTVGKLTKWRIPQVEPVNFSSKLLPVDPYLMGVILGDGHVSERDGITICTDIETIIECRQRVTRRHETSSYTAYSYVRGMKPIMRELDLMGKRSWEKHAPIEYMTGSIKQRLSLLQGLLDTDGSPIEGGGVEFSSTSEQLTDAVVELAQSLGGIARKKGPRITKHQNGDGRESWRVNVKLPAQFSPFRLNRKLNKWQRPTKYHPLRKIKSIEFVGDQLVQCISVNNSDKLYVTKDYIVTHNTPITLTTIVDRMNAGQVKKTLIFGPLRVIQAVWAREARKWEHTKHLRFSVLHGPMDVRNRALFADADIYLCNYEGMNWLAQQLDHYYLSVGKPIPFDMVVYDEVSKLKNSGTARMKGGFRDREDKHGEPYRIKLVGWRKIIPHFKYRTGLTGTPASNGYLDLFGQYLAVDGGQRLGEYVTGFKNNYFMTSYNGFGVEVTEVGKQYIETKIGDITKKMDAIDYLDMPKVTVKNIMVDIPPNARKAYTEMEKEMFTKLDEGTEVEVFSKAAVSNKLLQFCNGTPYHGETKQFSAVHDAKLDALESILEEAAGSPVLCSYSFKSDADRIMKKFKKYKPVNMTATKSSDTEKVVNDWNDGKIKLMIGHPASMGHGIDGLQQNGHILVWFGVNWSLELYEQMNGRLNRNGQKHPVSIIRVLCNDTVDLAVCDAI